MSGHCALRELYAPSPRAAARSGAAQKPAAPEAGQASSTPVGWRGVCREFSLADALRLQPKRFALVKTEEASVTFLLVVRFTLATCSRLTGGVATASRASGLEWTHRMGESSMLVLGDESKDSASRIAILALSRFGGPTDNGVKRVH